MLSPSRSWRLLPVRSCISSIRALRPSDRRPRPWVRPGPARLREPGGLTGATWRHRARPSSGLRQTPLEARMSTVQVSQDAVGADAEGDTVPHVVIVGAGFAGYEAA